MDVSTAAPAGATGNEATLEPTTHPHRRRNLLTDEWVIVSPHRTKRPWSGATSDPLQPAAPRYDPSCYLCPGNPRAGGSAVNPHYTGTHVFENDFAALLPDHRAPTSSGSPLFELQAAEGECRVLCFSPDHSLTLANMDHADLVGVVDLWREQAAELEERWRWVQIFETRGDICGSSNPHPHGQLWASDFLPNEAASENRTQRAHYERHSRHLLLDYLDAERRAAQRIVIDNDDWVVVVPWWAYWPYETLVLPTRHIPSLSDITPDAADSLATTLSQLLKAYNRLFDVPFPYCSGWHSAGRPDRQHWQLHAHYYPPLLRSADVAKIPASYELLAEHQRDFTPEYAADRLRDLLEPT